MTSRGFLALSAALLGLAAADRTLPGPASPADQPRWLANITAWAVATRAAAGYNGSVYDSFLPWTPALYIAPQSHIYDRFLYTPEGGWTPDLFLDDLQDRYGGIDGALLWASYPNMGVDEDSQFDVFSNLPGGLPAFAAVVARFHERGVRVGLPYNPWDSGTARRNATDAAVMAALGAALGADWVNGDTMSYMSPDFWSDSVAASNPLALQPEGGPELNSLAYTKIGWGYWTNPQIPAVDAWKWLGIDSSGAHAHATQICNRWATSHATDIQQAVFNGDGFVSWESVWGTWNGLSPRDAEATRRAGAVLRFLGPAFLTSAAWEPHAPLAPSAAAAGVYASRWPAPTATAWTLVNRGPADVAAGAPVLPAPCGGDGAVFFDLLAGERVDPAPTGTPGECAVSASVEAGFFGTVLAVRAGDADNATLTAFLAAMRADTLGRPLASFSPAPTLLQQAMAPIARAPAAAPAPDAVLVPGAAGWRFAVTGTEIEGRAVPGNDVQFPWEAVANTAHAVTRVDVPNLFVDVTPVTNAAYAAFLAASGYAPADETNFLRDWPGPPPRRAPPPGWANKPVTWVDLNDARAYCAHAGKRLPNDWEWSFLASNGTAGQLYPWGNTWGAGRTPAQTTGTTRPPPPDVGGFPSGDSPAGVKDLFGLVWQWTNEFTDLHTRAGLVRGGSYYVASGSSWYFPSDPARVSAATHNKLLLMAPSYDRHGTVGFRCVADAPGAPPPPPPGPPAGCADGECDALCSLTTVQGCAATLAAGAGASSLRAPRTGAKCGGALGACAALADACAPGWEVCLSNFSAPALSLDGFRARVAPDECAGGGAGGGAVGKFLAAMSHAPPGPPCPPGALTADAGCRATGFGSEAICCGSGCVLAGCKDDVWPGATLIYDNQSEGCGAVQYDTADGVLCCKLDA